VERLKLDVTAAILEEVHHQLEIIRVGYVPRHDCKVGAIQENLAKEL